MPFFSVFKSLMPNKPPTCSVVIAAAGSSLRCSGEDKLLYAINGKPVLVHTVTVFQNCNFINEIIIVTKAGQLELIAGICKQYNLFKVKKIIPGGDTRAKSVLNGIYAVSRKSKLIAIHDGARPCIDNEIILETLETANKYHAAAPGVPVTSTVKRTGRFGASSREKIILETIDRIDLTEIQTPQIFKAEIIKAALTNADNNNIPLTDDCLAVELIGMPVHITAGSRRNIKITDITDLEIAKTFLNQDAEPGEKAQ